MTVALPFVLPLLVCLFAAIAGVAFSQTSAYGGQGYGGQSSGSGSSSSQAISAQGGGAQSGGSSSAAPSASGLSAAAADPDQTYRIGTLDTLEVSVFQVDSLSRVVLVDGTGRIDLPLIQEVMAAGKTPRELGADIAARFSAQGYLQSPEVTVMVRESARRRFTVAGEVKTSGVFPLSGHMTLMQGIAAAGGAQPDANLKRVVVFRMVGQKRGESVVNLSRIQSGKADDPDIAPGDVIVVPVSGARRNMQDMASVLPFLYMVALFR
jgi:polysaccharide export outer membrane protein